MGKRIVYTNGNGKVEITTFSSKLPEQHYIDLIVGRGFSDAVIIGTDNFPDGTYQDAWELSGSTITVNLTKAKEIKKQILQNEVDGLIPDVNKVYLKALSNKRDPTTIEDRLTYLKNLPSKPEIDAATTLEELDAVVCDPWTEPDIDALDEDLSKIPTIFMASSESVSSTTSDSYSQKVRLNFTTRACPYFVWYYSEVYTSNRNNTIGTRVQIDDTETIHEANVIPAKTGYLGWGSMSGEYIKEFTEGSHFIDLDFKTRNNGNSVSLRRTRIYVTEIVSGN